MAHPRLNGSPANTDDGGDTTACRPHPPKSGPEGRAAFAAGVLADPSIAALVRVEKLSERFVEVPDTARVDRAVNYLIARSIRVDGEGNLLEGRNIRLVAPTGGGKTKQIKRSLKRFEGKVPPKSIVYVSLPGRCLLRQFGEALLAELSPHEGPYKEISDTFNAVHRALRSLNVVVVVIEEFRNIALSGNKVDVAGFITTIKGLNQLRGNPISTVLTGVPEVVAIGSTDQEFRRRTHTVRLRSMDERSAARVDQMIEAAAQLNGASLDSSIEGMQVAKRLIHASAGATGTLIEQIDAAIERAVLGSIRSGHRRTLSIEHFAEGYADWSGANDDRTNPFMMDRFRLVAPYGDDQ